MQEKVITTISASEVPEELKQLHDPPAKLFLRGDKSLLQKHPRVGIVGARKFTPYGREVTSQIATAMARAGVTVVSGLALGVDSIAHKACVEAGGKTIAVLPCGIETIYPASHTQLGNQIGDSAGLLISEYPGKDRPFKHSFIERNRIIAGLSDVLVITEAAVASGSLHTAYFALELGVTIFAVPGNINSPYSAGTNQLIKKGAIPLLQPEDILEYLGVSNDDTPVYLPENEAEAALLEALKAGNSSTSEVISASDLDLQVAQTYLTMLEIKGVLTVEAGHWRIN